MIPELIKPGDEISAGKEFEKAIPEQTDVLVIGGGPAGLSAAIEAAGYGASVVLADENARLGGQLYKQIHKFFGSQSHYAGTRGFEIAKLLINKAEDLGVKLCPNTRALGILDNGRTALLDLSGDRTAAKQTIEAKTVILASGAKENALVFPGWTLPGVMGAGAAQTFANIHGVLVGKKILVVGSGNVGLIVSYQLMQAGAEIAGIVEAAQKIGGYLVHAGKVRRAKVPIYTGHTIVRAEGTEHVTGAVIAKVDERFSPVPGTEEHIDCDTILLAVGLSPRTELAELFTIPLTREKTLGGNIPVHDESMQSPVKGIFVAGDLAGVEEASTAMDEGRLAGLNAAKACGYPVPENRDEELKKSLMLIREGIRKQREEK